MKRSLRLGIPLAVLTAGTVAGVLFTTQPWAGGGGPALVQEVAAQDTTWRLCNTVVEPLPPDIPRAWREGQAGVYIRPALKEDTWGWLILVLIGRPWEGGSFAYIDAETSQVVQSQYSTPEHRALIERVLSFSRFEPLDPATAPWPYTDVRQGQATPVRGAGFINIPPDPGSGLMIASGEGLLVQNCRSKMLINVVAGPAGPNLSMEGSNIHPDDKAAFERFFKEMKVDPEWPQLPALSAAGVIEP